MCLAGLGWLAFVSHDDREAADSRAIGTDAAHIGTLYKAAFWLMSAMFIISAFLGPFF